MKPCADGRGPHIAFCKALVWMNVVLAQPFNSRPVASRGNELVSRAHGVPSLGWKGMGGVGKRKKCTTHTKRGTHMSELCSWQGVRLQI